MVLITLCVFHPILITLCVFQTVQNNGSWYLHVYLTKQGISPNPDEDSYHNNSVVYQRKCKCYCCYSDGVTLLPWLQCCRLNAYKRRRINNKVNLLTGTSEVMPPPVSVAMVTLI